MLEKNKRILQLHNQGMTMLETLAAFLILVIIMLAFLSIIQFSSKMTMEAEDRRMLAEELDEKLAHKTSDSNVFTKLTVSEGEVCSLKLTLNRELTSSENYNGGPAEVSIKLKGCDVYQLAYPSEDDPEVVVLRFDYNDQAYQ